MKWRTKQEPIEWKDGMTRVVRRFAVIPRECEDGYTRWLEWITILEKFYETYCYDGEYVCGWTEIEAWSRFHVY